jgi:hypothetical protein
VLTFFFPSRGAGCGEDFKEVFCFHG